MKTIYFLFAAWIFLVPSFVHAEQEKAKAKLSGQCILVAGSGNLQETPCANLTLKIEEASGKEALFTRTSQNGIFAIEVPADAKFKISVVSRLYQVISPTEEVTPRRRINLQIKMSEGGLGL